MTTSHIYLLISITICIICILPMVWLPVYKAEPEEKIRFVAVIGLTKIEDLRAAGVIDTETSRGLKDTYNTFSTVNGLVLHTQWMDDTEYSDIRITNSDAEFFADWIAYDYCQKKEMTVHEFLLNHYEKGSEEMQEVVNNLIWHGNMAKLFK